MYKYIFMEVTNDEFELPICVADTEKELSEMAEVSYHTITSALSRQRCHKTRCRFVAVPVEVETMKYDYED